MDKKTPSIKPKWVLNEDKNESSKHYEEVFF